ncbi:hypothetical protein BKA81DRAFT_76324 [Phyllosticta paracitricarpa]
MGRGGSVVMEGSCGIGRSLAAWISFSLSRSIRTVRKKMPNERTGDETKRKRKNRSGQISSKLQSVPPPPPPPPTTKPSEAGGTVEKSSTSGSPNQLRTIATISSKLEKNSGLVTQSSTCLLSLCSNRRRLHSRLQQRCGIAFGKDDRIPDDALTNPLPWTNFRVLAITPASQSRSISWVRQGKKENRCKAENGGKMWWVIGFKPRQKTC